ncbi:MAG: hypothetical protein E7425_06240 [Ruminococcaceae bacterium]|nr:hypothetical protein [Oscillospiraceae bacterium]
MAQNSNEKRMERREKSDRNMNRAVVLLITGLVAEWYLLMADRYYARGTVTQMLGWYDYFGVMRWAALGVFAVGVALLMMRAQKRWTKWLGGALAVVGAFLSFTSFAMRHYFPTSVTVLCVLVPVLLILGIIYLFYQTEFSMQATALAMALFALVLLSRSGTTMVKVCAVLAILGCAALLAVTLSLKKNGGKLVLKGRDLRLFPASMDYRVTLCVLAACIVLVVLAFAVPAVAFYATWVLAVGAFVLAVYYTIKLM